MKVLLFLLLHIQTVPKDNYSYAARESNLANSQQWLAGCSTLCIYQKIYFYFQLWKKQAAKFGFDRSTLIVCKIKKILPMESMQHAL